MSQGLQIVPFCLSIIQVVCEVFLVCEDECVWVHNLVCECVCVCVRVYVCADVSMCACVVVVV